MGKQGSPRSPRPKLSLGTKDYQIRSLESLPCSDPSIGRRYLGGDNINWKTKVEMLNGLQNEYGKLGSKGVYIAKRHIWFRKHIRSIACMVALMGFLFLLDSFMVSIFDSINIHNGPTSRKSSNFKEDGAAYINKEKPPVQMYSRLLNLASSALAESSSHRNQISGRNHTRRQLYGNLVLTRMIQKN